MSYYGEIACIEIANGQGGLTPDLPNGGIGIGWKIAPQGISIPSPDPVNPQCIVKLTSEMDIQAALESHPGVLFIFEYGLIPEGPEDVN